MRPGSCIAITVGVLFAGLVAWHGCDLVLNYVPVTGMVTASSALCYLQRGGQRLVDKTTHQTIEVPCRIAEAAVQPGQPRAGYDVRATTTLIYRYRSPADGAWHSGQAVRDGPPGRWPKQGASIRIYAHKKAADTSKFVS